jgi:hypothetical protein
LESCLQQRLPKFLCVGFGQQEIHIRHDSRAGSDDARQPQTRKFCRQDWHATAFCKSSDSLPRLSEKRLLGDVRMVVRVELASQRSGLECSVFYLEPFRDAPGQFRVTRQAQRSDWISEAMITKRSRKRGPK